MVELVNKEAIADFNLAYNYGANGFYIITASAYMHRRLAASFVTENVAVYDYSGKENSDIFSPKELFYFIENNNEKEVFFILNFQIPFLGKPAETTQPDYFALNLCRDLLNEYNKKIFFFTTKDIEKNISTSAMDFFDYCFPKIDFEDENKDEIEQQIIKLGENYDNINHTVEIEYRLNLYKDKIEEYLNIDDENILKPIDKKYENYLLVVARDLNNFAGLYAKISNFDKALELLYKALNIREKILGVEHINTANTYHSIGYVYSQYDYTKALEYYEKALIIREKVLGKEHSDVAASYNNIGYVYYFQGNYSKMLEYLQKALIIHEKVLGKEHPNVAMSYHNIGYVYYFQGNYSKALEYYQKALIMREKVLGNEHQDIAASYNNIGLVYHTQGNYSKALEYYQKALSIWEKVLGNEHPNTATTYNNIGLVYDNQGEYTKALEFLQKALKIRKKVLGDNHPDTVGTYNAIEKINKKLTPNS